MANFWPGPSSASVPANLTGIDSIATPDYIRFDTTAGIDQTTGSLSWDTDFDTLAAYLGDVTLQLGQEHLVRVKNASVSTAIADGTVVMLTGSTGDTVTVAPAVSDGTYQARTLVGIATQTIDADGFGFVTQFGFVNNIKTDYAGWAVGDLLYADPNNAGALTKTHPLAPAWDFPIAAVTRVQAESGRILVRAIPAEANAQVINTDGDAGTKIYAGSVDPDGTYTLAAGDIWIETP